MENNFKQIESLVKSAFEYGKSGCELAKLKTVDKAADVVSTLIPHAVVFIIFILFTLFFNLGLAFWLGEIFGNLFYGFFVVAAFHGLAGLFIHFFLLKWFKNKICNFIVKQLLE